MSADQIAAAAMADFDAITAAVTAWERNDRGAGPMLVQLSADDRRIALDLLGLR